MLKNVPSGFVKEQKKLRLGCQLNANGKKLALFDIQSFTWRTNNSLCEVFHFQHLDNILNIVILFLSRNALWLTKQGTESQGFTNGCSFEVKI